MRISDWSSDVCSSDLRSAIEKLWMVASGLATPLPAMSGAEPCTGSNSAMRRPVAGSAAPIEADGSMPSDTVRMAAASDRIDRKSDVEGKSGAVSVHLGGRRVIQKKNKKKIEKT